MIKKIKLHNLGTVNKNEVIVETDKGSFILTFSYLTVVSINWDWTDGKKREGHRATIQNYWSVTTGKLLNELEPNKKNRLTEEDFTEQVDKMFKYINK